MKLTEAQLRQVVRRSLHEQTGGPRDVAERLELSLEQFVKIVLTRVDNTEECKEQVVQFVQRFLDDLDLLR